MVKNVQYSNGRPSHLSLPFEYWTPITQMVTVYSHYIPKFGIQMFPVFKWSVIIFPLYWGYNNNNKRLFSLKWVLL